MTTQLRDPDLEARVRRAFADHESLADPDIARLVARDLAVAAPAESRVRRRVLAAVAAAVLAVVGGVAATQQGRGLLRASLPGVLRTSTASVTPETEAKHRAVTDRALRDALARAPRLPGGRATTVDETGSVPFDVGRSGDHLISHTAYSLAPGSVDNAITYLRSHAPAGFTSGGWGSGTGRSAQFVDYQPTDPVAAETDEYAALTMIVTVMPHEGQVAMRTDVQAKWRPVRLAGTRLPADARLVSVVRQRVDGSRSSVTVVQVHAALNSELVQRFAGLRAAAVPLAVSLCPLLSSTVDTFTLTGDGGPFVVTARLGCGGFGVVTLSRAGVDVDQPLEGAASLDDLVRNLPDIAAR